MVTEHRLLQDEDLTISIHQSHQDLIISLSIDHLILMLHHHLHQDILDMEGLEDLIIIGKQKGRALHDLLLSFESYLAPLPNSTTLIVSNTTWMWLANEHQIDANAQEKNTGATF